MWVQLESILGSGLPWGQSQEAACRVCHPCFVIPAINTGSAPLASVGQAPRVAKCSQASYHVFLPVIFRDSKSLHFISEATEPRDAE